MDEPRRRRSLLGRRPFRGVLPARRRSPLRSFALGGLLGAAGALATARRLRRPSGRPRPAAGLAAFEDAPCFREVVEREGHGYPHGDPPADEHARTE